MIRNIGLVTLILVAACGDSRAVQGPASSPAAGATAQAASKETAKAVSPTSAPAKPMFELQMQSLREYVKAFNRHDAKAIAALYAEEAAFVERGEFVSAGTGAIATNYQDYFDAFPDATTSITRSWHWGDAVLFEYVEGGTHKGPHRAHKQPTGKKTGYAGASFIRLRADGLIKADNTYSDELTKEVQAGWAPGPLAKMDVRPVMPVPAASESWEVHKVPEGDPAQSKSEAARKSLYSKFSLKSEKDFLAAFSEDVVVSAFDDPKDAKGKRETSLLFKDWTKTFSDGVVDATEGWTVDGHVVLLGAFTGKHVGAWGPLKPTNKTFTSHFLDIVRVGKDDKIERVWSYSNNYELLKHLGYQKDEVTTELGHDPMSPR